MKLDIDLNTLSLGELETVLSLAKRNKQVSKVAEDAAGEIETKPKIIEPKKDSKKKSNGKIRELFHGCSPLIRLF